MSATQKASQRKPVVPSRIEKLMELMGKVKEAMIQIGEVYDAETCEHCKVSEEKEELVRTVHAQTEMISDLSRQVNERDVTIDNLQKKLEKLSRENEDLQLQNRERAKVWEKAVKTLRDVADDMGEEDFE